MSWQDCCRTATALQGMLRLGVQAQVTIREVTLSSHRLTTVSAESAHVFHGLMPCIVHEKECPHATQEAVNCRARTALQMNEGCSYVCSEWELIQSMISSGIAC